MTVTAPHAPPAAPMTPHPFVVQRALRETDDTFTLELAADRGFEPLAFRPGQFNMLYVFGVGEVPISISGDPATPQTLVHTTRVVGATTRAMGQLKRGDQLGVRGPFGTAWPVEEAEGQDVLFVAGGIGLAPLRPALYRVLARRERYGRVVLLYGARTPDDILFRRELRNWRADFDLEVHVTVDRATREWLMSPTMSIRLPSRSPSFSRKVNPSSSAWVGCSCAPSPALTTNPFTCRARKWGAPEAG